MMEIFKKLNFIEPKERYSKNKKLTMIYTIITLAFILSALMFFNVSQWSSNVIQRDINVKSLIASELLALNPILGPSLCEFITQCIIDIAKEFNIDPLLIFAIIKWESWGDPHAKNEETGAMGLMAVLHSREERRKWKDYELCDIRANLGKGTKILREKMDKPIPYAKFKNAQLPSIVITLLRYNGVIKNFYSPGEGFEYASKVLGEYIVLEEKL